MVSPLRRRSNGFGIGEGEREGDAMRTPEGRESAFSPDSGDGECGVITSRGCPLTMETGDTGKGETGEGV